MKVRTIRSPQVAKWLLQNGCRIERIKRSSEDPRRTFFVFEENGHIQELIDAYVSTKGDDSHE